MEQTTDKPKRVHHGRNVKRIREFQGVKQEAFAQLLGSDWNQRKISAIENKETLESELIEQIAKVLNVPAATIEELTDEMVTNFFNTNNFYDNSSNQGPIANNNCPITFNPLEKLMEVINDNKALNEKNEKLYEALIKVEREKNALLEKLLNR